MEETKEIERTHGSCRKVPRWVALEELEQDRERVALNKDRVKTITQKLSKLQQGLEVDKNRSKLAFEKRLKELETKIQAVSGEQDQRLEEADQQIENLMEALGQERLARELLDERKTKEGELLMKSITLQLEEMKQTFVKTQTSQTEQLSHLQNQVDKDKELREEAEQRFGVQLGEQVSRLTEEMALYRNQNAELLERVARLESQEKQKSSELDAEKKARTELEEHVVDMLEDLCSKLRSEIVKERNDRESMEETLLKLIEETCSRVEGGLVSSN